MVNAVRYLVKKFYVLCAVVLISLALLVQGGRSLAPLVERYPEELAAYLSEQLGLDIRLGAISADWQGLKPSLYLRDVTVFDGEGHQLLAADSAHLNLDLLGSVRHWTPAWGEIALNKARLALVQSPEGYWGIPGLPGERGPLRLHNLWDLVQLGTRVQFRDTRLKLMFSGGEQLDFVAPNLLLENRGDFRRLSLNVDLEDQGGALRLVVEGRGDSSDPLSFRTRGYLKLDQFPVVEPFGILEELVGGASSHRDWYREGRINADLWFDRRAGAEGYDLRGRVALDDLSLPIEGKMINTLATELTGRWSPMGQWQFVLQDARVRWGEQTLEPVSLGIAVAGPQAPFQVMANRLDLGYWNDLLNRLGVFDDGQLSEVLQTLNPQGELRNMQLTLPRDRFVDWEITTELVQVAVAPWEGVPGLTGVDGFLVADRRGGRVDLDSREGLSTYYAQTYDAAMSYQTARGQVAWHLAPEDNQIYVNSGPITLSGDQEQATGSMWLSLPWERNSGDIDLYLQIDATRMDAGLYAKYLPKVLPDTLRDWLDLGLSGDNPGRLTRGQFVFRGTLNTSNPMARTHQLDVDFERLRLRYGADWPALTELKGHLWLDDVDLEAELSHGQIYNSRLHDTRVTIEPNSQGEGPLLRVNGEVDGIASDGLRLLRESALGRYTENMLDSWYMHGDLQARLSLAVPLMEDQPGARQDVVVDLDVPRVAMDNFDLEMGNLKGQIRYTDTDGLEANALEATLFDEPLQVFIASQQAVDDVPQTIVTLDGAVDSGRLARWSRRPGLRFLDGLIDYRTRIELNHREDIDRDSDQQMVAVSFASDFRGVAVDLPAPYGKTARGERDVQLNAIIGQQTALLDLRYGDLLQALVQAEREDYALRRVNVALGESAQLPAEPRLHLSGRLEQLNLPLWQEVWARYQGYARDMDVDSLEALPSLLTDTLPISAEIQLGSHELGPLTLEDLKVGVESRSDGWHLDFTNDTLQGQLRWFQDSTRPLTASLDYLRLEDSILEPGPEAADEAGFDPRQLPWAEVTIDSLTIGEGQYGTWSFVAVPEADGARFTRVKGQIRGLEVTGIGTQPGAELYWYRSDGVEETRFSGLFVTGDMAQIMRNWGQADIVESESARYEAGVHWEGPPWAFGAEQLVGDVTLELNKGRFKRNPAGGSDGLLRLFAVLNFDSLARRLRLDFSDLYQSGLAYDSIQGRAEFDRGLLTFREPLQVRSPSSRMQLVGRVDLVNETLNSRLVATLPVAGNLTFLTALAAGLPAAAGVFIVSKLFEKQMDQATSISYTISGDWDDPQVKFDRMFEGDVSLMPE